MSTPRHSFSYGLKFGLICFLAFVVVAGSLAVAAPKRRGKAKSSTTSAKAKAAAARKKAATAGRPTYSAASSNRRQQVQRVARLKLVVAGGTGVKVTLDVNQGVGRLIDNSETMFESDIYLVAGRTYTFTYTYEDVESEATYKSSRTWLERDGRFFFDFAHKRRKPGSKAATYKRLVYVP